MTGVLALHTTPEKQAPDAVRDAGRYVGSLETPETPPVALKATFSISSGRAICLGWADLLAAYERAAANGSAAAQFRVNAARKADAQ